MKKNKKIFGFFFLCLAILFTAFGCSKEEEKNVMAQVKERDTITWGVKADTRLFGLMNVKNSQIEGFDVDIAKALTKEILGKNGKAQFVEVTSKTRIPFLKNGNVDALIATMTISDERKKVVDFSDVYFEAGQSLLVKKDSRIKNVKDLDGKKVLAIKGSTSAINIRKKAPKAKILEMENYAEGFTALKAGQGEALTTDNAILYGMASEDPDYGVVGGKFTDEPYGIATDKGQKEFVTALNKALKAIKANGTYDKIYQKWFKDVEN